MITRDDIGVIRRKGLHGIAARMEALLAEVDRLQAENLAMRAAGATAATQAARHVGGAYVEIVDLLREVEQQ